MDLETGVCRSLDTTRACGELDPGLYTVWSLDHGQFHSTALLRARSLKFCLIALLRLWMQRNIELNAEKSSSEMLEVRVQDDSRGINATRFPVYTC